MLQFQSNIDQSIICGKIVKFLEQRGVLFMDLKYEIPNHVFDSIKEIRIFLIQMQVQIITGSQLEVIVDSINHACRHFMNTCNINMTMTEIAYSLGAMRKIIGVNLLYMSRVYGVSILGHLKSSLPY